MKAMGMGSITDSYPAPGIAKLYLLQHGPIQLLAIDSYVPPAMDTRQHQKGKAGMQAALGGTTIKKDKSQEERITMPRLRSTMLFKQALKCCRVRMGFNTTRKLLVSPNQQRIKENLWLIDLTESHLQHHQLRASPRESNKPISIQQLSSEVPESYPNTKPT